MKSILLRRASLMDGQTLTLRGLLAAFWPQVGVTWVLTLAEVGLLALIPLLIGEAIDGLLAKDITPFWHLGGVLFTLIVLGTLRRLYDTRAYGLMRVALGKALVSRSQALPVSQLNARLGMGRELVDFLEIEAPESMTAILRVIAAIVILATFHAALAVSVAVALVAVLLIYALAHRRFFRLNEALNAQTDKQVGVLNSGSLRRLIAHLLSLRRSEVRISDTEGLVYGVIFTVLLAMVMFNLWFATQEIGITAGKVFAIVTYSWDFVESALVLPMTLQSLTRLSEITARINQAPSAA
jgi:ABC-type multidrug transport system fused ATPase/permease subunit